MIHTMLAAVAMLSAMQGAVIPDRAVREPEPAIPLITATIAHPEPGAPSHAADEHLQNARSAMRNGDFDIARREFTVAATQARAAGQLPAEEMVGLANALYSLSYNREAAMTMERLADEARLRGDSDTEAAALADAIWLNVDAGQRLHARKLTERLRTLMKDSPITLETLRAIRTRLG